MNKLFSTAILFGFLLFTSAPDALAQRGRNEHNGRPQNHERGRDQHRNDRARGGYEKRKHSGPQHYDHRPAPRVRYERVHHAPRHSHRPPAWARAHRYDMNRHVYFPDYYTFYDANRGGYTYWQNNAWIFTPTLPSFLVNVDLGRARIQVMGDIPLHAAPQGYYRQYHNRFPVPRPLVPPMFIPRF
jgi:hypothetical protein